MKSMKAIVICLALTALTQIRADVQFSDSFNRANAGECNLGSTDNAAGGTRSIFYLPIFSSAGAPAGAAIANNSLQNRGLSFGGVQFTTSASPCATATRGADSGQNFTFRARIKVPADAQGRVSYAGPFFRSRLAAPGESIVGAGSGGFWVQLANNGEIRVVRLDLNELVGSTVRPASFDAGAFHELQVAVQGDSLQIVLDNRIQRFSGCAVILQLPDTGAGNQGGAGLAFGTDAPGQVGGQQIDDFAFLDFTSLSGFPTSTEPSFWIQSTNTVTLRGSNSSGSVELFVCDLLNEGILRLDSTNSSWDASVRTLGYLSNAPNALIEVLAGTGGSRAILADVFNSGTLRANTDLRLNRPGGIFNNDGQVVIGTNLNLNFDGTGGQVFNQRAGTFILRDGAEIQGSGGILNVSGGTVQTGENVDLRDLQLNYLGGQFSGPAPYLFNTDFRIAAGLPATLFLIAGPINELQSELPTGQTLWIQGSSRGGSAVLNATNGLANRGVLRLESVDTSWDSSLVVQNGALTNTATGVINIELGTGGSRYIQADVLNQGAINVRHDLRLSRVGGLFINQGTLDVQTNLDLFFDSTGGQVFNQQAGTLRLRDNVELQGQSGTLNVSGGTVQFGTNVSLRDLDLNYLGGQFSGPAPYLFNTDFRIAAGLPATLFLIAGPINELQSELPTGQTLWIQGSSKGGSAVLNATNGLANRGVLQLESVDTSWDSSLVVQNGALTNTATGVITIELGTGGSRYIQADVLNQGAINVRHDLRLSRVGGLFINQGTVDVQTNLDLHFDGTGGQVFNQQAGTLRLRDNVELQGQSGTLNVSGGTVQLGTNVHLRDLQLNYLGGQFSGPAPYLFNTDFRIAAGLAPTLLLIAGPLNELQSELPAGQTLWIQGSSKGGSAVLNGTNGLANRGVLRLESVDSSWDSSLIVQNGALTNTATGVINIELGTGGSRYIQGDVVNQGAINVRHDLRLSRVGGLFINQGTLDVQTNLDLFFDGTGGQVFNQQVGTLHLRDNVELQGSGGTLTITGGAIQLGSNVHLRDLELDYIGGQFNGQPAYLFNTDLKISTMAAPATFIAAGAQNELHGLLPAGQTLWIQGSSRGGSAVLNATNGLVNRGLLRLESVDSSWNSDLDVRNGLFVNSASGRLQINEGTGGARQVEGQILNEGAIRIQHDASWRTAGVIHTNAGTMEITTNATLRIAGGYTQTGGETILSGGTIIDEAPLRILAGTLRGSGAVQANVRNAGTIAPGAADLNIIGALTQENAGTIAFKTMGTPSTDLGNLTVNGAASLTGTLRLEAPASYSPPSGERLTLITATSISGTFQTLVLPPLTNQLVWRTIYSPTSVAIEVGRATNAVSFGEIQKRSDGQFQFTFSGAANQRYAIEASTNLINWVTLTNFVQSGGALQFVDPASTNLPRRFYRAIPR